MYVRDTGEHKMLPGRRDTPSCVGCGYIEPKKKGKK